MLNITLTLFISNFSSTSYIIVIAITIIIIYHY